jgi:hypothetical protein
MHIFIAVEIGQTVETTTHEWNVLYQGRNALDIENPKMFYLLLGKGSERRMLYLAVRTIIAEEAEVHTLLVAVWKNRRGDLSQEKLDNTQKASYVSNI